MSGKLTDSDKELLAADGVTLPATNKRHKKESYEVQEPSRDVERKWNEVRSLMDPNPQLQGMHKGRFSNKVSPDYNTHVQCTRKKVIILVLYDIIVYMNTKCLPVSLVCTYTIE